MAARAAASGGGCGGRGRGGRGRGGGGRGGRDCDSRGCSQQFTGSEQDWATAMGALFGAGEMEARMRTAHPAGCLEVLRARRQSKHFERWQREMVRQGEQVRRKGEQMLLEFLREPEEMSVRTEELERGSEHRG